MDGENERGWAVKTEVEKREHVAEQKNNGPLLVAGVWLSFLASVVALGGVVWKGGALQQTVINLEQQRALEVSRIDRLEKDGSGGLKAHEVMDDVRVNGLEKRLSNVEQTMATIAAMQADIREIRTRLEMYLKAQNAHAIDGKTTGSVIQW